VPSPLRKSRGPVRKVKPQVLHVVGNTMQHLRSVVMRPEKGAHRFDLHQKCWKVCQPRTCLLNNVVNYVLDSRKHDCPREEKLQSWDVQILPRLQQCLHYEAGPKTGGFSVLKLAAGSYTGAFTTPGRVGLRGWPARLRGGLGGPPEPVKKIPCPEPAPQRNLHDIREKVLASSNS
jgi:hypothetical protein